MMLMLITCILNSKHVADIAVDDTADVDELILALILNAVVSIAVAAVVVYCCFVVHDYETKLNTMLPAMVMMMEQWTHEETGFFGLLVRALFGNAALFLSYWLFIYCWRLLGWMYKSMQCYNLVLGESLLLCWHIDVSMLLLLASSLLLILLIAVVRYFL